MNLNDWKGIYPFDWPEIAASVKEKVGNRCERCGHPNDPPSGHMLGVHHLDRDKSNVADWNLAALCQRCHLHIEGKTLRQVYEMSLQSTTFGVNEDWLKPHLPGIINALKQRRQNEATQSRPT